MKIKSLASGLALLAGLSTFCPTEGSACSGEGSSADASEVSEQKQTAEKASLFKSKGGNLILANSQGDEEAEEPEEEEESEGEEPED